MAPLYGKVAACRGLSGAGRAGASRVSVVRSGAEDGERGEAASLRQGEALSREV
jgi:hypothetical protein